MSFSLASDPVVDGIPHRGIQDHCDKRVSTAHLPQANIYQPASSKAEHLATCVKTFSCFDLNHAGCADSYFGAPVTESRRHIGIFSFQKYVTINYRSQCMLCRKCTLCNIPIHFALSATMESLKKHKLANDGSKGMLFISIYIIYQTEFLALSGLCRFLGGS